MKSMALFTCSMFVLLAPLSPFLRAQEVAPLPVVPTSLGTLEMTLRTVDPHSPRHLQSLLIKREVQAELNLAPDAYHKIFLAQQAIRDKTKELAKEMTTAARDPEAMRDVSKRMLELSQEREQATQEALSEMFPPASFERLKQIAYQVQIKEVGLGNVLVYGTMAEEMEFSATQWENLDRKAAQFEREKQEKIREIIEEYDAKLLKNLTPTQRRKYQELVGEPFEYQPVPNEQRTFERIQQVRRMANGH